MNRLKLPTSCYYHHEHYYLFFVVFVFVFAVTFLNMYVKSEGCEDRFKTAGTCGIAYIKVQNVERSLKNRGHNVVVADGTTGMLRMQSFFVITLIK